MRSRCASGSRLRRSRWVLAYGTLVGMTTTEMPWVTETRLAPGQQPKRNTVFGWVAAGLAALGAIIFVVSMVLLFTPLADRKSVV